MAAINKVISYKGKKAPTGKGLAAYLAAKKANRDKVLLLNGLGQQKKKESPWPRLDGMDQLEQNGTIKQ